MVAEEMERGWGELAGLVVLIVCGSVRFHVICINRDVPAKSPGRKMNGGPPVKGLFEILPPTCGTLPFKLVSLISSTVFVFLSLLLPDSLI